MFSFETLNRRNLLMTGGAFASVGLLSGCFPLFGIMLRGGALRAFASGARLGGSTALVSLGRGIGIASRGLSSSGLRSNSGPVRIVSPNGSVLAQSVRSGQSTVLIRGNQHIFRSNANSQNSKDVGRLDHIDIFGNGVGRSIFRNSQTVDHYLSRTSARERRIGFDIISRNARLIKHFDSNENEIGQTKLQQNGEYTDVIADPDMEKFLTNLEARDEKCPEIAAQRQSYYDTIQSCNAGNNGACLRQNRDLSRLRLLERSCK